MNLKDFTDTLMSEFDKNLTDIVFLYIESNKELMEDYLKVVSNNSELKVVNSQIARAIEKHYTLQSTGIRNEKPKSQLIKSYEEFKKV